MINLSDISAANNLLVSLGGEDQMSRIAATAIDRSLELQHRVDRALKYASEAPPNSLHAKNMARILDGSITVDDELNEIPDELSQAAPRLRAVSSKTRTQKPKGLAGRSTRQRKEFREWLKTQGIDLPRNGPIDQIYIDAYDEAIAKKLDALSKREVSS